jgi:hypothetical protein
MLRCRWLRSGKYKKPLFCWQKGKRVKKSECRECLGALRLSSITSYEVIKFPAIKKESK